MPVGLLTADQMVRVMRIFAEGAIAPDVDNAYRDTTEKGFKDFAEKFRVTYCEQVTTPASAIYAAIEVCNFAANQTIWANLASDANSYAEAYRSYLLDNRTL